MNVRGVIAAAAAVLSMAGSAGAAEHPRLSLSRPAATPGARVVLAGHGFARRAPYRVTLAGATVSRLRAGRRGGFRFVLRVPSKAAGLYRVRVRTRGRTVASVRFRIRDTRTTPAPVAPAPQQPVSGPPEEPAPSTPPPPPPPPVDGPTLVAVGDIACSPTQAPGATSCHQGETADLVEELDPDAVAVLGDNQYQHGELADYNSMYDPTWGRMREITHPAVGNHEYEGDPERDSAPGYFGYFGDVASGPDGYYRWSLGNWTIFVLNSGALSYTRADGENPALPDDCWPVSCAAGSAQLDWLTGELDSLPDDACVLAYWHHPRFSSGFGGRTQDYPETGPMYDALYEHGAELVLNGHVHNYERFKPVDASGAPDATSGTTEFVVGTGGRSLFPNPGPQKDISERLYTDAFGVLELSLEPDGWASQFVTETGEVRDEASGTCHGPPA